MTGRLEELFSGLRERGRRALGPYFASGFPDRETSRRLIVAAIDAGADFVEIGVPFSDPIADGPAIQYASEVALSRGMTLGGSIELARDVSSERPWTPLLLMTYYNPVLAMGLERFLAALPGAGVAGLVLPDLSLEAFESYRETFERHPRVEVVQLVALTTPLERARRIAAASRGFVYVVGVTGVTGARDRLEGELPGFVAGLRGVTNLPLAVGFGISGAAYARQVATFADGAVLGSALIERIRAAGDGDPVPAIARFVRELRDALG
ncbi:MAG: tryptophan synthase subunit alpha [Planctomycetes bacterium]|nr:tryptophan synthase subunit alpha [Planctomycetota bacterium]